MMKFALQMLPCHCLMKFDLGPSLCRLPAHLLIFTSVLLHLHPTYFFHFFYLILRLLLLYFLLSVLSPMFLLYSFLASSVCPSLLLPVFFLRSNTTFLILSVFFYTFIISPSLGIFLVLSPLIKRSLAVLHALRKRISNRFLIIAPAKVSVPL